MGLGKVRTIWAAMLSILIIYFLIYSPESPIISHIEPQANIMNAASGFNINAVYSTTTRENVPNGVALFGSWLGSDEPRGEFITKWYSIRGDAIVLYVAGYPTYQGNQLSIEIMSKSGNVQRLDYLETPRETWQEWRIERFDKDASKFRVVAIDGSSQIGGWLGVSEPLKVHTPRNLESLVTAVILTLLLLIQMYFLYANRSIITLSALYQGFIVFFILSLFFDSAAMYMGLRWIDVTTLSLIISVNLMCALLICLIISKTPKKNSIKATLFNFLKARMEIFVILLVYLAAKIQFMDNLPRWDAGLYFKALIDSVNEFSFNLDNLVMSMNWYGHPTSGYAFLLSILQFWDVGSHYFINLTNLVLSIITVYSFFGILEHLWPENRKWEKALISGCVAFQPLFFGTSLTLNTDTPLIYFFIPAIYFLLAKRLVLFAFTSILLVFTKELGILMYLGFISMFLALGAARYLLTIRKERKLSLVDWVKAPFGSIQMDFIYSRVSLVTSYLIFAFPVLLFACYLKLSQGHKWGGGASTGWNNSGFNTFGISGDVVVARFYEMFLLNFNWVISLFLVIYLLKRFLIPPNNNEVVHERRTHILKALLATLAMLVLFNLLYITFVHSRYVVSTVVFLILFLYMAINNLSKNSYVKMALIGVILLLNLVQVNHTIDPVSKSIFRTYLLGDSEVLEVGGPSQGVVDGLVYNAEYTVIDRLINRFNKKIGIDENTNLILQSNAWGHNFTGGQVSDVTFNIGIDSETKKRTYKLGNAFFPKVTWIHDLNEANGPDRAYFVRFPWLSNREEDMVVILQFYDIVEETRISQKSYYIEAFELMRKDNNH